MRHGIAGNRLQRNTSLRKATFRDLAKATLIHQRICTTKALAKQSRRLVERLITLGKKNTLAAKRRAFAILCDHQLVSDLFKKIAPRFKSRAGGYTRIILLANRRGDNAQLVYLELTEKEKVIVSKPKSAASSKPKDVQSVADKKEAPIHEHLHTDTDEHSHKEKHVKPEPKPYHKKDKLVADKGKPSKIMGGFKQMFNKKPSES